MVCIICICMLYVKNMALLCFHSTTPGSPGTHFPQMLRVQLHEGLTKKQRLQDVQVQEILILYNNINYMINAILLFGFIYYVM